MFHRLFADIGGETRSFVDRPYQAIPRGRMNVDQSVAGHRAMRVGRFENEPTGDT